VVDGLLGQRGFFERVKLVQHHSGEGDLFFILDGE